ncbi:MAG: glycoside hydrolase family 92 protein [Bacteroidetes bacterium]|nr:MAG: glycoside hydrolase family 92 protein [Bacteroidota bacterium]
MNRIPILLLLLSLGFPALRAQSGLTRYVDPFLGVDGGGNVLPGPCMPFGMVRPGPDIPPSNATTGYQSGQPIDGFSQNHLSGTGGGGRYGHFMLIPQTGTPQLTDHASPASGEAARVGYYGVTLDRWGIQAELTCDERVSLTAFTFPATDSAWVLLDLERVITRARGRLDDGRCIDAFAQRHADGSLSGYGIYIGGWGHQEPYRVFFALEFEQQPVAQAGWEGETYLPSASSVRGPDAGWMARFDTRDQPRIQVKVALSTLHEAQARANLKGIPHWDFDRQVAKVVARWDEVLSRIEIRGASEEQYTLFYTALYRCFVMPTDISGENPAWHTEGPSYWDYYAIWDTYRTLHPLLTLIAEDRQVDMLNSLLDIYRHRGWLPDAWVVGDYAHKQGGTNADVLFADAAAKGLRGVDYELAYEAMLKQIEVPSPWPRRYGRHPSYLSLGYCPSTVMCGSSYTLEYAYNDYCIAQLARHLGKDAMAHHLEEMSLNCYELFHPEHKYFWAKDSAGIWAPDFSPEHHGDPWWEGPYFYEGTPAHYATYVPHDMAGLIRRHGGAEAFVAFLDQLFDEGWYNQGNEPDIMAPFLYQYAGRPDKSAERVQHLLKTEYRVARDGWPGNDDAGCMSSWYIFASLGLYPNAGQDVYLLGSPAVPEASLWLGPGRNLRIKAWGLSPENRYVKALTVNGQPWDRCWLQHGDIAEGATLVFEMGPEPSDWGTHTPPPSLTK